MDKTELGKLENALIGFLLAKAEDRVPLVLEVLNDENCFADPKNRSVFKYLREAKQFPSDIFLLAEDLAKLPVFSGKQDVVNYLNDRYDYNVRDEIYNPSSYLEYAKVLRWETDKNLVVDLSQWLRAKGPEVSEKDRIEFFAELEQRVGVITTTQRDGSDGLKSGEDITKDTRSFFEKVYKGEFEDEGVKTGIRSVDDKINSLGPGEVTILAAGTGVGKSSTALYIARHVALTKSVFVFSLEMTYRQMMDRMAGSIARVSIDGWRKRAERLYGNDFSYNDKRYAEEEKRILDEQYCRLQKALECCENLPIFLDDTPGLSPMAMQSIVNQEKSKLERNGKPPLGLIVIDYIQLMGLVEKTGNRVTDVDEISRQVKKMAKHFRVPILVLAQFSRKNDAMSGTCPSLSDLRESASLEQDADRVVFVWRRNPSITEADFADEDMSPLEVEEAVKKELCRAVMTVAKNRQGATGDCDIILDNELQVVVAQSKSYEEHEDYNAFLDKYWHKTRSGEDIFWPLNANDLELTCVPGLLEMKDTVRTSELRSLTQDPRCKALFSGNGQSGIAKTAYSRGASGVVLGSGKAERGEGKTKVEQQVVVDDIKSSLTELELEDGFDDDFDDGFSGAPMKVDRVLDLSLLEDIEDL